MLSPMRMALVANWLLLSAFLTACGDQNPATVGEAPPELSVLDMADRPVRLSDYKGKVVVLRFWSGTCAACLTEMPQIEKIYQEYRDDGFVMLGVNMGDSKDQIQTFAADLGISYPVLLDELSITAKRYGVFAVPTSFVVDREGIVRDKILGEARTETFENKILTLLDPSETP